MAAATATSEAPLPGDARAAALLTLVIVVLLGLLVVAAILLGGHWVRRQGTLRGPAVPPDRAPLPQEAAPQPDAGLEAAAESSPVEDSPP